MSKRTRNAVIVVIGFLALTLIAGVVTAVTGVASWVGTVIVFGIFALVALPRTLARRY